jgi:hypothetical protein
LTAAQQQQFEQTYLHMAAGTSFNATNIDDHDMYITSALLQSMLHPWGSLSDVPLSVTNTGAGNYSLSWTAPAGAQLYRMKESTQPVVDWIGFNPKTNAFTGNPATSVNWFAATEVTPGSQTTCPGSPAAAGTHQSCTISGLDAKQSWHFAMKAKLALSSEDR